MKVDHSIILTIHNKDWLIDKVIQNIYKNTTGSYELIIILDGCSDNSEEVVYNNIRDDATVLYAANVFETTANNMGLRRASADKVIIVQDDMVITEQGWNERLQKPFSEFHDVFAVTARMSHNWIFNQNSQHLGMKTNLDTCWCDIIDHVDHASKQHGLSRDTFAVRCSVNRGPLMIDHSDLEKLNYLDEEFAPQDMDDHDLCYRAYKQLDKIVGSYWIDYQSDDAWGGTRVSGQPAPWLFKAHHKNTKLFYERHKDLINNRRLIDNRELL